MFNVKEWNDLETGDSGRSRSLKMALFDRSYTTFYWYRVRYCKYSSTPYHSRVIWITVTLKSGYRSLKVIQTGPIRKPGSSFLFAFHSRLTMAVSLTVYDIFSVKE